MKKIILSIIGLIVLVVVISGCTSSANTYDNSIVTFHYPEKWTVISDENNIIVFNTSDEDWGEKSVRVAIYNTSESPVQIESFTEEGKAGNNEYKELIVQTSDLDYQLSYVIQKNGYDFIVQGHKLDRDGMKQILETVQFK